MIITKRGVFLILILFLGLVVLVFGPTTYKAVKRQVYGVKSGVRLNNQLVEKLLEEELYNVVASLGENAYIEANNAYWDWTKGEVREEVVGRIVDVQGTVKALLSAPANANLNLVTVEILPSITAKHFQPYYRGPTSEPRVALMINVDWGDEFILDMLEVLEEYDASTTWFPTGRWAERTPELARKIAQAGHEIGNHGGWHGMASQMSRSEVTRLIQEGEDKILQASGQKPLIFAPPAGDFKKETVAVAAELGYKTVLWTIDTVDWQRPAPTVIVDRVIGKISNGALVLMHPTKPTLQALPVILDHLRSKGFRCVTVSELLAD